MKAQEYNEKALKRARFEHLHKRRIVAEACLSGLLAVTGQIVRDWGGRNV